HGGDRRAALDAGGRGGQRDVQRAPAARQPDHDAAGRALASGTDRGAELRALLRGRRSPAASGIRLGAARGARARCLGVLRDDRRSRARPDPAGARRRRRLARGALRRLGRDQSLLVAFRAPMKPETWAIVGGRPERVPGAPLNTPLVPASNFVLGTERLYSRTEATETWEAFEDVLGGLEGGHAVSFSSGMAACNAV